MTTNPHHHSENSPITRPLPIYRRRQATVTVQELQCSIGIMAYNEAGNIERTLRALQRQHTVSVQIYEIIVVVSGCTDDTLAIVQAQARQDARISVLIQEQREGKASAINLFLQRAKGDIIVLISADVLPHAHALETLCAPLLNESMGMVGGRPIPLNDAATFMGHAAHLLWLLHDTIARQHPKLGEIVAFRNIVAAIPKKSATDELSLQAQISQLGYQLAYQPTSIVYNQGPLTMSDFLQQRRRIFAGHLAVRQAQQYEASTLKVGPILLQLLAHRTFAFGTLRRAFWTCGVIVLEGVARLQGFWDYLCRRDHSIWHPIASTKTPGAIHSVPPKKS